MVLAFLWKNGLLLAEPYEVLARSYNFGSGRTFSSTTSLTEVHMKERLVTKAVTLMG